MGRSGLQKVIIATSDTEVATITVFPFSSTMLEELSIKFGFSESLRLYDYYIIFFYFNLFKIENPYISCIAWN